MPVEQKGSLDGSVASVTQFDRDELVDSRPVGQVLLTREGSSYQRVVLYFRGRQIIPGGKLHDGWTGTETVVEKDFVRPARRFLVAPAVRNDLQEPSLFPDGASRS